MNGEIDFFLIKNILVSIALAGLIGLERERQRILSNVKTFGGVRTFALIGLMGSLAAYFMNSNVFISLILFASFAAVMIVSYFLSSKLTESVGLTSEIAAFIVFLIGFMAGEGKYFLATFVSLILLFFLFMKNPLHLLAEKIKQKELLSTVKFMIVAFVILPLLPNQGFGPYSAFNPYIIWLMVVFVSGISFASYLAIKFVGPRRGLGLTGFLAGLISSTALALSFAGQSKNNPKIVNSYVFAMLVASSALFFRVLVEVSVLNPELLNQLIFPLVTMGLIGTFGALFFWLKKPEKIESIKQKTTSLESPFQLKPALKFGFFFAFILFLSNFAKQYLGDGGVYITSFISGLLDVDAITVSMAQLANEGLDHNVATMAITIAAVTNTFVKAVFFLVFGNKKIAKYLLFVFALMFAGGFLANFLL